LPAYFSTNSLKCSTIQRSSLSIFFSVALILSSLYQHLNKRARIKYKHLKTIEYIME
jgi:hypothetical protein